MSDAAKLPKSSFLVTGGAGFIGSNLVEALLGSGHDVRVLDNLATGRAGNLADADAWAAADSARFEFHEGDIRDADDVGSAMRDVDFVIHLAALGSVPRSVEDPQTSNDVNVNGTLRLLLAARDAGVRRFVFASSSSLYGESEELPKHEGMAPAPVSPYGLQKLAAETYCGLFHRLYGLPTVSLRYFNVFGRRQNPESDYAAVIPRFITAIRSGDAPVIYGDGEQTRDFTYVENVIEANRLACAASDAAFGRAFNIACGDRISLNALAGTFFRLAGREPNVRYEEARAGDIKHSLAAIERATDVLGYTPGVSLEEGLAAVWERF